MNLRRQLLTVLALTPFFSGATRAQSSALKPTPQDALGPFYPPEWRGEIDNDLLSFGGKQFVKGTPLALSGRVLAADGRPITDATVEIWQTDDTGKYRHPDDDGEGPAQRGFQGFGRARADADGHYSFRTIKPVLYSGRSPHVHFKVVAPDYRPLVTQLYFLGENSEHGFGFGFVFSKERELLTVSPTAQRDGEREGLAARFDLVLAPV